MSLDKKQEISLIAVALLLLSATTGMNYVNFTTGDYNPWVWHNPGIFILVNGTVAPADAPIQQEGNIFKFTSDVSSGIDIQRNNTILDGNGFTLFGNGYGTGVLLQNVSNIIVQNLQIRYFTNGIYLDNSNRSTIRNNILAACTIEVSHGSYNQITANNLNDDISVNFSDNNTVTRNTVSSVSVSWSKNITIANNQIADPKRRDVDLNSANYTEGIYIDNIANSNIFANTIQRKNVGIDIWQSTNLTLTRNTLTENQVGFKLWGNDLQHNLQQIDTSNTVNGKPVYFLVNQTGILVPSTAGWIAVINSKNITVQNWAATPNWDGVLFVDTQNSRIINSNFTGNFNAIRFDNASNCTATKNWITNSLYSAFYLERTINSTVTGNEFIDNHYLFGIGQSSANNSFYENDFVGNTTGPIENGSNNQWDNGRKGNYWSTFTGVDLNHDGISDVPNIIDINSNVSDRYPLMTPQNTLVAAQKPSTTNAFTLAMPQEYLNYTVADTNGTLWAEIDGIYPMHISSRPENGLPMIYPTPPNTKNIHVWLDGAELNWSSSGEVNSMELHYTDIGMWKTIYCQINPASNDFLLQIHYEHPIQVINGSFTFLYDLNISPYLSPSSTQSIAYFNIQIPTNLSHLNVYRTGSNGSWTRINYNSAQNDTVEIAIFNVVSKYSEPLLGDVAFVLGNSQIPELPALIIFPLITAVTLLNILVKKKRTSRHGKR